MKIIAFFIACFATTCIQSQATAIKPWTILIYIAGDNDLEIFIDGNINDMAKIGSNPNCNIVLCVARKEGKRRRKKLTYILVQKNYRKILFESCDERIIDSGEEKTFQNFCTYAITSFPAHNYGLIFWDHGTGPLDPSRRNARRSFFARSLFPRQQSYNQLAILPILCNLYKTRDFHKALCFDDSTGNFLNEVKLQNALENIFNTVLQNKKFALIGFDTCLMANVETASLLKDYGCYMVASQEVEPGTGWNYEKVFSIFTNKTPTPFELGSHIVHSYKKHYSWFNDLTLSCVDLERYKTAEKKITMLIQLLELTKEEFGELFIKSLLRTSSHKKNCTHFDEPEYIDIIHFLENLLYNFEKASINKGKPDAAKLNKIEAMINETISTLQHAIVANACGKSFTRATGLSIYFPINTIDSIYKSNVFCCATQWAQLLRNCL